MNLSADVLPSLRAQRRHVTGALVGLGTERLTRPAPPTTWAPLAVVNHLAIDVERFWFQAVLLGDAAAVAYFQAHPDGAWDLPLDGAVERYEREAARTDEILASCAPDTPVRDPAEFPGSPRTAFAVLLHVIGETATHAGQLDVVRESIVGTQWIVLT